MQIKAFIFFSLIGIATGSILRAQTNETDSTNLPVVSTAPVSYRVNESGSKLHGYYKKEYKLVIYGDSMAIGFRADCDKDDDWSGANVGGTTQSSNSFESTYKCVFNPNILNGTVLPGNKKGLNHYDGVKKLGVAVGDLTITYKLDKNNKTVDSIIGVVFDRGPHNQPGESSVATCNAFKSDLDNSQFIYIVFPNSAQYVRQIIGTKANSKTLKRDPTNDDFAEAYKLMLTQNSATKREAAKGKLVNQLARSSFVTNFDNATPQEKAEGKLKAKNDDRNVNE